MKTVIYIILGGILINLMVIIPFYSLPIDVHIVMIVAFNVMYWPFVLMDLDLQKKGIKGMF